MVRSYTESIVTGYPTNDMQVRYKNNGLQIIGNGNEVSLSTIQERVQDVGAWSKMVIVQVQSVGLLPECDRKKNGNTREITNRLCVQWCDVLTRAPCRR